VGKVTFDISMSLDGYIAGPNDDIGNGLGDGGEQLHEWLYDLASWRERHGIEGGEASPDADILEEAFAGTGAVVMGKRMFQLAEPAWGDDPPFHMPAFVVTHEIRDPLPKGGGTIFHFVPDGVEAAIDQAHTIAGTRDISVAGGADVIRQCLDAGLIDEFQVHVAPVLLGGGRRLFEGLAAPPPAIEATRVAESPTGVTHLKYRVVR
jgi:dihydrofolate reductase